MKGAESKKIVTDKILSTFEGSFLYNGGKEIRIPLIEDGDTVQIKVVLTAAKVNVESEGTPVSAPTLSNIPTGNFEITEEEKQDVVNLIDKLGL